MLSAPLHLSVDCMGSSPRRFTLQPPNRDGLNSSCLCFYLLTGCVVNMLPLSARWLKSHFFLNTVIITQSIYGIFVPTSDLYLFPEEEGSLSMWEIIFAELKSSEVFLEWPFFLICIVVFIPPSIFRGRRKEKTWSCSDKVIVSNLFLHIHI